MTPLAMIVCGDRFYKDADAVQHAIDTYQPDVVIEGGATGADMLAAGAALHRKIRLVVYTANWKEYGRRAGVIRNSDMLRCLQRYQQQGWRVLVLAFHDNIEASKGTADMIRRAVQAGVDARLYEGGHDGSGSTRSR